MCCTRKSQNENGHPKVRSTADGICPGCGRYTGGKSRNVDKIAAKLEEHQLTCERYKDLQEFSSLTIPCKVCQEEEISMVDLDPTNPIAQLGICEECLPQMSVVSFQ
jgi:hypothetical protein